MIVATAPTPAADQRRRRHRADRRLRLYGIAAISLAVGLLAVLVVSLLVTGWSAFTQTKVRVDFPVSTTLVDPADPGGGDFLAVTRQGIALLVPGGEPSPEAFDTVQALLTRSVAFLVRDAIVADPSVIGGTLTLEVPAADPVDQFHKGRVDRATPEDQRRISDAEIAAFDALVAEGRVSRPFNTGLFLNPDSRFPELAGLAGAIVGSAYLMLVCIVLSVPMGVAAAVWLEEFAPRNRLTDLIEVNVNNLTAVPSIVFGLLGLAVLLQTFGLPRSAPLVGGIVLALMTLPTIIIVTRNALRAVPPSIREAGYAVGASKHQVVLHHVLPLALPGILTGTIIGLAHALGETAPLLLIGMNAFVTSPPGGVLDASTALPTQIFIWADSPERGFTSRTSAAILVLLGFLIAMNGLAVWLRHRLERRW
jgi:phosphate transport system permease protein